MKIEAVALMILRKIGKQETSQVRRMLRVPRQTVPHSPMLHLVGFPPGRAATSVNYIIFGLSGEWVFTCSKSRFVMKDIEKGVSWQVPNS